MLENPPEACEGPSVFKKEVEFHPFCEGGGAFFTLIPRNGVKGGTALSMLVLPGSWPASLWGCVLVSTANVCGARQMAEASRRVPIRFWAPWGTGTLLGRAHGACFQAGHSCPFCEAVANCPCFIGQQRNPQGMGPGPFLPPNNHSELMDFIWSLRSNDAFGQGLRQLAAHCSSFIRSFSNFGEVKRLLGQLYVFVSWC